jgi:hypothetical protein
MRRIWSGGVMELWVGQDFWFESGVHRNRAYGVLDQGCVSFMFNLAYRAILLTPVTPTYSREVLLGTPSRVRSHRLVE